MNIKTILSAGALVAMFIASGSAGACDAAGKSTHIGSLMTVNAEQKTFTIQDAQSHGPLTFSASKEIIDGLKDATGNIMVNYKIQGDGLTAIGVAF